MVNDLKQNGHSQILSVFILHETEITISTIEKIGVIASRIIFVET